MATTKQVRTSYYHAARRGLQLRWPEGPFDGVDALIEEAVLRRLGAEPTTFWEDPYDGDLFACQLEQLGKELRADVGDPIAGGSLRVEVKAAATLKRKQFLFDPEAFDLLIVVEWTPIGRTISLEGWMLTAAAIQRGANGCRRRRVADLLPSAWRLPTCEAISI